ncbi:MAG: hypothetical protein PVF45_06135 [Anaerolineae bacterium]|jgi:hypothetical protein
MLARETVEIWTEIITACANGQKTLALNDKRREVILDVAREMYHLHDVADVTASILESGEIFDPWAKQALMVAFEPIRPILL